MEELGFELLAIYHSHPNGPDHPSPTDLAEHAYPETAALIWYPQAGVWRCRAFWINEAVYKEINCAIEDETTDRDDLK